MPKNKDNDKIERVGYGAGKGFLRGSELAGRSQVAAAGPSAIPKPAPKPAPKPKMMPVAKPAPKPKPKPKPKSKIIPVTPKKAPRSNDIKVTKDANGNYVFSH